MIWGRMNVSIITDGAHLWSVKMFACSSHNSSYQERRMHVHKQIENKALNLSTLS